MPPVRRFKWIGPGYFETLGNRLVAGRALTWNDSCQRLPVVMISKNLARELFKTPGAALGKRIRNSPSNPWREIVGVAGDEHDDGVHVAATPVVYWPMALNDFWDQKNHVVRNMAYAVRSERLQSAGFLRELQQAVWSVNANLPVANPRSLAEIRAESMAQTSFALTMLSMSTLLFGVGPMDPITYVAVSFVLGTVALVATYLPARRAARVDPVVALRTDA